MKVSLKEKNLIIRVDASTQIGTGHLMRCLALAQAWKGDGGKVTFITACQSEGLLQRLREEEFDIHLLAHSYPDSGDWDYTKSILAAHPNAWVVLDGYHFDEVYQQRVKEAKHRLLVIDDMAHLKHYYADIVLNQNLHAKQLQYSCEPYTRLLLGTHYVLLRREFLAWRGGKREIPEVARRVLVTLGGSDPENYTLKVLRALQKIDIPGLEATVVIGVSNPHADVLEAAVGQSRIPIRLISNATNMPELMAWADVAVSMAGTTTWELLFLGMPALFCILADNQYHIAQQVESQGVGKNLGQAENISVQSLVESITSLAKDFNLRAKISENARQIVDGQGGHRVLEALRETKPFLAVDTERTLTDQPTRRGKNQGLRVFLLAGKQAGCIGLLTLAAAGCRIQGVIAYDDDLQKLAAMLHIPIFSSLTEPEAENHLSKSDLLVSVHGREIVPKRLFELPRIGGINVHPCLYRYKGANPIGRLLQDGCTQASVAVHLMTEKVDEGEVLVEEFIDVAGKQSVEEVYNALYPYYSLVLLKALRVLEDSVGEAKHGN